MADVEQRRVGDLDVDLHLGPGRHGRTEQPLERGPHLGAALPGREPQAHIAARARRHDRARLTGAEHVHVERGCRADPLVELVPRPRRHLTSAHGPQRIGTGREPRPRLALALAHGRDARAELLGHPPPAVRRDPGEHREQDVRRVQHRAPVEPRVQVTRPGADLDQRLRESARPYRYRRRPLVGHQRVEHDRAVGVELRLAQPLHHRRTADLLLALDEEAHVHGQLTGTGELAGHVQERQVVALVVRRAAGVQTPVTHGRLERRRGPRVERAGVLNVVVAVGEHGRRAGTVRAQLPDRHRMTAVQRQPVHAPARRLDSLADPVAGARKRGRVPASGRDRGDPQPVDELVEE
jgi:hypothetical protein